MDIATLRGHLTKYVELRLSCGSVIYGKLQSGPTQSVMRVDEAYLCWGVDVSIENRDRFSPSPLDEYLEDRREHLKNKEKDPSAKSPFDTVDIATEHVTMVRDVSDQVESKKKEEKH
jgi:hypothetical protein